MYIHISLSLFSLSLYIYIYTCILLHMYVCMYVCTCMYVCMYIYIYIYIYIYTFYISDIMLEGAELRDELAARRAELQVACRWSRSPRPPPRKFRKLVFPIYFS